MSAGSERPRLREYRTRLGWTQKELADRLAHLGWMVHREHVAVNADMVAKWERGAKGVSSRYRELLCRLFGVSAEQLGVRRAAGSVAVREVVPAGDESLVSLVDRAAQLLDQLGAPGMVLAPHLLEAWKDGVGSRRVLLGVLDPAATDPVGRARVVTATVAELEQLAERYEDLHETAAPVALMTPVVAHLRMIGDALGREPVEPERRRLLRNRARVAILAGRLAAEDLGNRVAGRAYYGVACDSAQEVGEEYLAALAYGHTAHLAAAEGMSTTALEHVAVAAARAHFCPGVGSWLACLEATVHADRGELAAAREALDRARAARSVDRAGPGSSQDTLMVNLSAVTGHVLLRAGQSQGAVQALSAALEQLRPAARRERVLVLVDLALTELHRGNLAASCGHATEAARLLQQVGYALGAARLRAFRTAAQQLLGSRALRALDEQLSRVAA